MKREGFRFPRFGIKSLAIMWLFPGLVIAMVVGNQDWWIGPIKIGQYISLINYIAVSIIMLMTYRRKIWPLVLIVCIISTRLFSETFSDILLNFLFCTVGALIAYKRPSLIYRQLMFICLINLIFVILQITGAGQWAHFTVHWHGGYYPQSAPINTLFVEMENLGEWGGILARPAGLTHANNILSFLVLFGIALHFPRTNNRVWWGSIVLCSLFFLGGAKMVLLGFILISLNLLISGNRKQRRNVLSILFLAVIILAIYALLFPGLFEINTAIMNFRNSIFIRINDIVGADVNLSEIFKPYLEDTPNRFDIAQGMHISGYSYLAPYFLFILPFLFIMLHIYYRHYRRLYSQYPFVASSLSSVLIVIVIFPFATPFGSAQIYWFVAGFALLPIFMVFKKRFLQQFVKSRIESISPRIDSVQRGFSKRQL